VLIVVVSAVKGRTLDVYSHKVADDKADYKALSGDGEAEGCHL
jgi:hypothetical protein